MEREQRKMFRSRVQTVLSWCWWEEKWSRSYLEERVCQECSVGERSVGVMNLKLEIKGVMFNVVSGYATQLGCQFEEKEK